MARLALAVALAVILAGCGSSKKTAAPTEATGRAEGEIVFSVFEDMPVTQCGGLFAVTPGNGRIRALAGFGRAGPVLQPLFSPDGRTFTVASFAEAGTGLPGQSVYRFDQRSGRLRRLAKSDSPFAPVWSPRSDAFLVLRVKRADVFLHAIDVPSGHDHEILRSPGALLGYTWSPDGTRVAYTLANRPAQRCDVWTAGRDGANQRLLARDASDPSWLRDGTIAFWTRSSGDASDLKVAAADGTHLRTVPGGPFMHSFPNTRMFETPGKRVLLLKQPKAGPKSNYNDGDLVVQEIAATQPGKIVAHNVIPVQWSPSGKHILLLRPRLVDGETVFLVSAIDPDGGNERAVAVIDEQDINGALSFPAWNPQQAPVATAKNDFPVQPQVRDCAPKIEALRRRLSG